MPGDRVCHVADRFELLAVQLERTIDLELCRRQWFAHPHIPLSSHLYRPVCRFTLYDMTTDVGGRRGRKSLSSKKATTFINVTPLR